ncbi:hypothetical protein [Comamonas sp. GB3 AK4-5]|uniref:hypothetical protein n=1 Tax=Comamonas sp. GB3 AK4-5 TaxID=3231487 RepID=UPI00351E8111
MAYNASQTVVDILGPWFLRKSDLLHAFSHSGASFEEWLNWELFAAFLRAGHACEGRPHYGNLGQHPMPAIMGDLLSTCPHSQGRYLMEMALVGSGTQNKWRAKIQRDHEKLLQLDAAPSLDPLHKVQLVFLAAADDTGICQKWDDWLQKIPFYGQGAADSQYLIPLRHSSIPTQGEAVLMAWNVR